MEGARDVFLVVAAVLIVFGSMTIVALEFGSSAKRRLVSYGRDAIEVLLPPVLILLLLWLVWLDWL
jgi:ribosomal protein L18E